MAILLLPTSFLCIAVASILFSLGRLCFDPLRHVPGPFAARFTRLWELIKVRESHFERTHAELHRRYGPIVRLAPYKYSISDPRIVRTVYGHGSKFTKGPFYHTFGDPDQKKANLFSECNIESHAAKRRKVASLYSMTTLLGYEKYVDRCSKELMERLHSYESQSRSINVLELMQFYAFDVIGEISVGKPFGFMQHGKDFSGIIGAIHESMVYGSRVGLFPELHPILASLARKLNMPIPFDVVQEYVLSNLEARKQGDATSDRDDFLTKLINMLNANKINHWDIITTLGANIGAGSDTTAISLSCVIYSLAKHPEKARKLRDEISGFEESGKLSDPITFQESQTMPYLQAVIKEALRIHPATGQQLSRIVPPGGATLCDRFFPEGTEIGTSPWLVHFDETIFGRDAHQYRPERWLEDPKQATFMDANMLSFGAGARTCIGKNISMLEISKVIPQLYREYDFVLDMSQQEWELDTVWFVKQRFFCRVISLRSDQGSSQKC